MGRKPKDEKKNIIRDRVGEKTDLLLCPGCTAHMDCFANIDGHCTALSRVEDSLSCSFYKSVEENTARAKQCYQYLKDTGRSDLISKYIKPLSAMGMLDDEIEAAEQYGAELEIFRENDYQEQLSSALENDVLDDLDDLLNDDLLDDCPEDDAGEEDDADEDTEDEDACDEGWHDSWNDGRP